MQTDPSAWKDRILYRPGPPADDRSRMRQVMNSLVLHIHPTKVPAPALRLSYTWGLGGISSVLALVLIATGVLLMFRYDAGVERAYTSIQVLETEVPFGSLLRGLHHWSANLLLVTAFLHLLRVFFTGGFKAGRAGNWVLGMVLLLMVVAFNFTGYLLPWDQLAYWAITVATSLLAYVPVMGNAISGFLLGGPEVGQNALRNFYAIHVAVLPALMILLMSFHFWRVRKDGGISQPKTTNGPVERVTTIPHLVRIEFAATALLLAAIVLWAMTVPAPLEELANPAHPPNPAKAAWYFMGLQELLLHMHPLAALVLPGIILAGLTVLPYWERRTDDIGVYFRSRIGRRVALGATVLATLVTPLLVIADEWWIDLPAWLPTWPTVISNGLLPLLLTLGGLALIYGLFRVVRANHSEAVVGLFSFIMTSLVLLTVIGVFFRGANMALIWPL